LSLGGEAGAVAVGTGGAVGDTDRSAKRAVLARRANDRHGFVAKAVVTRRAVETKNLASQVIV